MTSYDDAVKGAVAILQRPENADKEFAKLWDEIGLNAISKPNSQIETLLTYCTAVPGLMCTQVADLLTNGPIISGAI